MMPTVYLETTIPSYLTARLSNFIVVAGQQMITREWWETAHEHYELYVSEAVLEECRGGDPLMAEKRFELVKNFPILAINDKIISIAETYWNLLSIPEKAKIDALHLAFAVVYELDYLLTWNCKHLAHGEVRMKLHRYNQEHGLFEPMIVTPQELLERS